jgi:hypothetical protein
LIDQAVVKAMVVITPNATCISLALPDKYHCSGCELSKDSLLTSSRSVHQAIKKTMCSHPWVVKEGRQEDRFVLTAERIHDHLNKTVATPHSQIGNDWRSKRRRMERMDPVAKPTNDANTDAENLHPNISNHPIDEDSDEDDLNGLLDHEMMVNVPVQIETATNDDHPIGALANGDDGDNVDNDNDNGGDDGEDDGIVDGDTTTDSTSEVSNEDLSIVGQTQKRANIVRTRDFKFGHRIIKDIPNNAVVIGKIIYCN